MSQTISDLRLESVSAFFAAPSKPLKARQICDKYRDATGWPDHKAKKRDRERGENPVSSGREVSPAGARDVAKYGRTIAKAITKCIRTRQISKFRSRVGLIVIGLTGHADAFLDEILRSTARRPFLLPGPIARLVIFQRVTRNQAAIGGEPGVHRFQAAAKNAY